MSKSITKEEAMMVINELEEQTKRPVCKVNLTKEKCSIFDSKMGGIPYYPINKILPVDENGKQLWLLAQINFKQMPSLPDFPTEGILQFFIALNNDMGLDFKNWTSGKNFRVIYHKNIDKNVKEDEIKQKIERNEEEYYTPFDVNEEFKMNFTRTEEGISFSAYNYDKLFSQICRSKFPDKDIKQRFFYDEILDEISNGEGTKIGGYPFFTQCDPRDYSKDKDYDILLFQSDSDMDLDILWGDCGVANFLLNLKI